MQLSCHHVSWLRASPDEGRGGHQIVGLEQPPRRASLPGHACSATAARGLAEARPPSVAAPSQLGYGASMTVPHELGGQSTASSRPMGCVSLLRKCGESRAISKAREVVGNAGGRRGWSRQASRRDGIGPRAVLVRRLNKGKTLYPFPSHRDRLGRPAILKCHKRGLPGLPSLLCAGRVRSV